MNKKNTEVGTNISEGLTQAIIALEAETQGFNSEELSSSSSRSTRYDEADLIEHTKIMTQLFDAVNKTLIAITEHYKIKDKFLDKDEGFALSVILFIAMCISGVILRHETMVITFFYLLSGFIISFVYKIYNFKNRVKMKKQLIKSFEENRIKITKLLDNNNALKTYVAISYNSKYRITFNHTLFKMFRNEVESLGKGKMPANYRVWHAFLDEIKRGLNK